MSPFKVNRKSGIHLHVCEVAAEASLEMILKFRTLRSVTNPRVSVELHEQLGLGLVLGFGCMLGLGLGSGLGLV